MIDFNSYVGIRFANHPADEGLDCWQLVRTVYAEQFKVYLPAYDDRYMHALDRSIPATLDAERDQWVAVDDPQPGDVALFTVRGRPRHVGLIVRPGKMLHALKGSDSCIEDYKTELWRTRLVGIYRHRTDHR